VNNVLDLRSAEALARVGLTAADIESDVDDYEACVEVGSRAHQLGCHGVVAPSASRLGETLGLFPDHLPVEELPSVVSITKMGATAARSSSPSHRPCRREGVNSAPCPDGKPASVPETQRARHPMLRTCPTGDPTRAKRPGDHGDPIALRRFDSVKA